MDRLPRKIYLTATGKHWKVSYIQARGKLNLIELPYRHLVIYGKHDARRPVIRILNQWVREKAKEHLSALLIKLNRKIKVKYNGVKIHALKTEWGSSTAKKIIGLNYQIIFLPPTLVKHILIHELCHLRYFSHSPKFWAEVEKYDKQWKRHIKAIGKSEDRIPQWLIL